MILNRRYFENGVSPDTLSKLITANETQRSHRQGLMDYYLGKHSILSRPKKSMGAANNKIVANYAKYITQMSTAYFLGSPVTYSAGEGTDIKAIKDEYFAQNLSSVDCEIAKGSSIYGNAVELVYSDEAAVPRSVYLPPVSAFVVYDDTVKRSKLFGVYYYREINIDGSLGDGVIYYADDRYIRRYKGYNGFTQIEVTGEEEEHYFGAVPFIEYKNNDECQGDFEQEISIIDSYNTLMSDRVNDKEQFVDSFLLLLGLDITSDEAKELKEEKILCGEPGGEGKYLSRALSESDVEVLRNALIEDIHKMSMVPDLTDEAFAGNVSGVAIKYKLLGFEQSIRNKERLFEKGLRERLELYMNFLNVKKNVAVVPLHEIDIEFHRNLPANELEIAQMVSTLSGIVSDETLLARVPFVTDAKEEAELAAQERQNKQEAALNAMGGYKTPVKASEDDEE